MKLYIIKLNLIDLINSVDTFYLHPVQIFHFLGVSLNIEILFIGANLISLFTLHSVFICIFSHSNFGTNNCKMKLPIGGRSVLYETPS